MSEAAKIAPGFRRCRLDRVPTYRGGTVRPRRRRGVAAADRSIVAGAWTSGTRHLDRLAEGCGVPSEGLRSVPPDIPLGRIALRRSEERRVGKECRSRWSPYH